MFDFDGGIQACRGHARIDALGPSAPRVCRPAKGWKLFVTPSSPDRDRERVEQNRAAQTSVRTAIWQRADGVAETDCVAGVVGLELRNPLGSKSAGVAGEFQPI